PISSRGVLIYVYMRTIRRLRRCRPDQGKGKKRSICAFDSWHLGNLWRNHSLKVFAERHCWGIIEVNHQKDQRQETASGMSPHIGGDWVTQYAFTGEFFNSQVRAMADVFWWT